MEGKIENIAKNPENCNFGKIQNICLVNYLEVSSQKNQEGCNKNSDQESTLIFILHGHKTKSKQTDVGLRYHDAHVIYSLFMCL